MNNVIQILQLILTNLPGAITTAAQLYDLGAKFLAVTKGEDPTEAEIAQLRAMIDADVVIALSPLPPAQPGDPDYKESA